MSEIIVPGVPDLPSPPQATERAHVCGDVQWIEIPKGTRPTCEVCEKRLERYRHVAAGHGTVAEIREAIAALDHVDGQPILGQCVRIDFEGIKIWACPRSFNVGEANDPVPLVDKYPNRAARRAARLAR